VRQSGISRAEDGRSARAITMMKIMSSTSRIIAVKRMYFVALDDAD
jgi:hypothetical protein